jgi:hypothetical protein
MLWLCQESNLFLLTEPLDSVFNGCRAVGLHTHVVTEPARTDDVQSLREHLVNRRYGSVFSPQSKCLLGCSPRLHGYIIHKLAETTQAF